MEKVGKVDTDNLRPSGQMSSVEYSHVGCIPYNATMLVKTTKHVDGANWKENCHGRDR